MTRIYLSPPHMSDNELPLLQEAFTSNWIAPLGPHVDAFEEEMCAELGAGHAAALSSGTAGLHLALVILGVEPGDEVLCSTLTFAASTNVIRYVGATPVFIDADEETWTMDPVLLEEALRERAKRGTPPRAVIVVDLYGQCADLDAIGDLCAEYGVPIIEDAAEALGSTNRGRHAGTFGAIAVLSFNGNKIITCSGGGMLLSPDAEVVRRARFLATQARDPALHYEHSTIGYNYRLSNLLAAVGRGQLRVLGERVRRRREINAIYRQRLGDLPGVAFMPEASYGTCSFWLTCITLAPEAGSPRSVVQFMEERNIEVRPVWKPMHLQPVFEGCPRIGGAVSERLFRQGLCLPSGTSLSEGDLDRIIGELRSCLA